jgi:tRNA A-37 threonylcarbamoyl transferase component Bud32/tetratricopeptide (TPR) repeat protein
MTPDQEKRRDEILESILALDPQERAEFLAHACGSDPDVRAEVERLLCVRNEMDRAFLEKPTRQVVVPELNAGVKLGRYEVEAIIGRGGMSFVYRARDAIIGRKVALKVLAISGIDQAEIKRRFLAELQILGKLKHDNIVQVYDFGDLEGTPFMVMELLDGEDLSKAIRGGRIVTNEQRLSIARQISTALRHIHGGGILHRDIKPANVFLEPSGRVKLMDFGIARSFGTELRTSMTFGGTLEYMAPEQIDGEPATPRTDVYSFGILLFHLFTGRTPFPATTIGQLLKKIQEEPVPVALLRQSGVPVHAIRLIRSATSKDPVGRPQDFDAVLKMLRGAPRSKVRAPELDAFSTTTESAPSMETVTAQAAKEDTAPGLSRHTVGRAGERAQLMSAFQSVAAGRGLMFCVAGEAGIGKTTLIETFLSEATGARRCTVARGRSSERLAGTEAYSPLLEALEGLLRDGTSSAGTLIKRVAPAWYAQVMPGTAGSTMEKSRGASLQRMQREFAALLHELSRPRPLVLFIEDLHWADVSTIDLLGFIASKFDDLRVLVLVTYRPSDLLLQKHPFLRIKPDLQARGLCRELVLDFLSQADVDEYIRLEFPGHRFPPEFPALIYAKTEGSPLFMADVLRYLRTREVIALQDDAWTLAKELPDIERELPESVRGMIERKIAQLGEDDLKLLSVASVQGYEFDSSIVARVLNTPAEDVEERLETLEKVYRFVRLLKEREFPSGVLTLRYRFVHVLYQHAFQDTIRGTRKMTLAREVARALESFYGAQRPAAASELAALYEAGREYMAAAEYFRIAAHQGMQLSASQEPAALARRGLALLEHLPQSRERNEQEAALQIALGNAVMTTRGYAAREVGQIYERAWKLCHELGSTEHLLPAVHGMYISYVTSGRLAESLELGKVFLDTVEQSDPAPLVAHRIMGCTLFCMGELGRAREHLEQLNALYNPTRHQSLTWLYGNDPGMTGRLWLARTLWLLGYPDSALVEAQRGLQLANAIPHANSLAYGLVFAAWTHLHRCEWDTVLDLADRAIALSTEQGLTMWLAWAIVHRGRALAGRGEVTSGIAEMRRGLAMADSIGARIFRPQLCAQLAAVHAQHDDVQQALAMLDEAQATIDTTQERFWQAEVLRLRAKALGKNGGSTSGAESYFVQAIEVAKQQRAKSLELRAAASLRRFWRDRGNVQEAQRLMSETYGWFTEGFDTVDLRKAHSLLTELDSPFSRSAG